MHYSRWQRHGSIEGNGRTRRPKGSTAQSCTVGDCDGKSRGQHGYCSKHLARWRRHGTVEMPVLTAEERFWSKVRKDSGILSAERPDLGECWVFTGGMTNGYGIFFVDGKTVHAHRYGYEIQAGAIPDGLTIDHLCYTRNCVRRDHLEPVTNSENVIRSHGRVHYIVLPH